jgi:hypothetical protein
LAENRGVIGPKRFGWLRMATLTLPQALGRAASAYQAGALAEAGQLCRQIVAAAPYSTT